MQSSTGSLKRHNGSNCAIIATNLIKKILEQRLIKSFQKLNLKKDNFYELIGQAIEKTFVEIDHEIGNQLRESALETGSTALVILHIENHLFCANLGDSQAFTMGTNRCVSLSKAHNILL